ncbi:PREDICTED: homeobox-leucine zipper protein HDG7-like isoform X2 [Tarenaya hassleriana]|uniref:homeobox-leucine zipper protein HDG7-like isoform X2 n=1 Tax=Tarenaya hassleriana TaxID=28532 RepID=UPI00053C6123|nr:PREDICTED: homeobox-leucine zipper protein HDG7-like isoform X2 [Tarenaya hassleriana]
MMSFEGLNCSNSSAVVSATMPSSIVSLPSKGKMNGHGDIGLCGEIFDPTFLERIRDDEYENRSGSDNLGSVSADDQEAGGGQEHHHPKKKKKKYHRHSPYQIQELESLFKECPHPDEKQRLELSRRLGLEGNQIKFWFQNRRTQMKTQLERHENAILREENEKLIAENNLLKVAMRSPMCNVCGGPAVPGEVTFEQQNLGIENARLKDELSRVCGLANKFLVGPVSALAGPFPRPSVLDALYSGFPVGRTGGTGIDFSDGPAPIKPEVGNELMYERSMFIDLALAAMDELIKLADSNYPLWIKYPNSEKEALNHDEYRRVFSGTSCITSAGFVAEASRETGLVLSNSLALVETLMDANRWTEMFESIVATASTIKVISSGTGGTMDGWLQLMRAEFQVISPLVPTRQVKYLRYCKQQEEGLWAVVDVSSDINGEDPNLQSYVGCRRLPSGCIIQDIGNGCSKVTWVEHSEYDESNVHRLFRPLLSSGRGFGAERWLVTLQRQCESFQTILSSLDDPIDNHTGLSPAGEKSILKLAQRMAVNFYAGISRSSVRKWDKLLVANVGEDMRIRTRKNLIDPGEPSGIVLSAATSVWLPLDPWRLFDFLRDPKCRNQWDILSNGSSMQEMIRLPKGQHQGNCVSVLRTSGIDQAESTMLILQETWTDASGSLVMYAPVDVSSMNVVMNGGDSAYVALLPSGFSILPDDGGMMKPESDGFGGGGSGCLLSIGFQILVNSLPNARFNVESVGTVNNLISCTIDKIKAALQ